MKPQSRGGLLSTLFIYGLSAALAWFVISLALFGFYMAVQTLVNLFHYYIK